MKRMKFDDMASELGNGEHKNLELLTSEMAQVLSLDTTGDLIRSQAMDIDDDKDWRTSKKTKRRSAHGTLYQKFLWRPDLADQNWPPIFVP